MVQATTVATISAATLATGLLAYAVYFDHQRRKSADFRRQLRRSERQQQRIEKEKGNAEKLTRLQAIKKLVDTAKLEGFPTDVNEKELFFMEHCSQAEQLASNPSNTMEAALGFYKALKVYPSPGDLIGVLDTTQDKAVLDILAEMIAYDRDLDIGQSAPRVSLSDMPPHPGLD